MTGAPHLYIITDRHASLGRPLPEVIARALAGAATAIRAGARVAVQLREKDLDARALLAMARDLRAITAGTGAALFVNDRLDVALAVGADGVHLGAGSLASADIARVAPDLAIAISIHRPEEAAAARRNPQVRFAVFGPVFNTPGKSPPTGLNGPAGLRAACLAGGPALPILALGGINPEQVPELIAAGAHGVACIRAVVAAINPDSTVERFMISREF